jgi:hypothetical protein
VSSDLGLLRFLRGYVHDVAAAQQAFIAGLEWRTANDANRWREGLLMKQEPETASFDEIVSHYTNLSRLPHWDKVGVAYPERFFHGHDKNGNPIMITKHEMIEHVFALMTVVSSEEYDEFRAARAINLELYLDALSRNLKKLIKCVYIWDLEGMTRSLWKTWEAKCVKTFAGEWDHTASIAFPEHAHRIAAVHVPSWLMVAWKLIKSVIPGRTLRKVYVIGSSGVADALLKSCEIPASSLPKSLGGTCTNSPLFFAQPRSIQEFKEGTLEIPAGTTRTIEFDVSSGGMVYWSVYVNGGKDIIVNTEKTAKFDQSEKLTSQRESIKCEEFYRGRWIVPERSSGATLRLLFDNRSNIFFTKTIDYVVAPYPDVFFDAAISQE